ncbi:putative ATPase [Leptolyngbyaceae cyanobacterium JSC-12]|nr:putative ATPase [Leptolyngbyaceae cyanobacterium JSC-12]
MINQEQEAVLFLLKAVNFDWVMHMKSVWRDSEYDVAALHQEQRTRIIDELEKIKATGDPNSPLGMVLIGEGGAGKTHLLSAIRRYALSQGFGFILVDMTDVHDFWKTALQGYVSSLQEATAEGAPQFQRLIEFLLSYTNVQTPIKQLTQANASQLKQNINSILSALARKDRAATIKFRDIVRALFLLNSDDISIQGTGYNWLQGFGVEEEDKYNFGFSVTAASHPSEIVEGLSWLMSLQGPSVLAFDQLDSIVTQHHFAAGSGEYAELSDEQRVSRAIIEGIGGGFTALRDKTARTLILVSCLEATWEILRTKAVSTFQARFHQPPLVLGRVRDASVAEQIVASRLREIYESVNFLPPYPTWPFTQAFFEAARQQSPRRILQRCDAHRNKCLAEKEITELSSFGDDTPPPPPPPLDQLDRDFAGLREQLKEQSHATRALGENNEDTILATLLQTAGECLIRENPTADNVDVAIETDFPGGKSPLLHVRVRLIFRDEGDREQHLCLRALQRTNAKAYQTRIRAAMTASGIDRALSFRRLILVRTYEIPGGSVTQQLTRQFEQAGGLFAHPTEDELLTLLALQELQKKKDPKFDAWLRDRRPVSQLPCMRDAITWLFGDAASKASEDNLSQSGGSSAPSSEAKKTSTEPQVPGDTPPIGALQLPIGTRLVGQQARETIALRVQDLTKHTVILAGSGSGKTVLVRRLVEEAVLLGIPAIVIDCANDLARMGDRWPAPPEEWSNEDKQRADLYHQKSQVVVWTPGREAGNPLNLEPLPDLAAVANDPEELDQAADMARDSLQDIVAPGKAQASILKRGILKAALLYFAQNGGGRLPDLIELLSDLPPEAGGGIADAGKKAQAMADSLRAEILNNPLLRQGGAALDPAILFGLDQPSEKTRISILNFIGLPGIGAQQQFLNQLFMTLFTWIKKNPAPVEQPIRGLLVIDEAKDFVPSTGSTPCKASLNRLAAQARKYGLGLIFATQAPKSIDHNIIANCSTQFYGRANSPAAIDVIQEQLRQRGGSGQDIARLERGQFYVVSESLTTPTKILTPLCLSHHPPTPLDEVEALNRARASRTTEHMLKLATDISMA